MSKEKKYYVYVHRYASGPKMGQVFYVGKGCGNRVSSKRDRNIWWKRIFEKYGYEYEILIRFSSENCAISFEIALIKFYGRSNLVNLTNGGDGTSGHFPSAETRKKMSKSHTGRKHSDQSIKKMTNGHGSIRVSCSNGMEFKSISDAIRWLRSTGVNGSSSLISQCCRGIFKSAYGFSWWPTGSNPVAYVSSNCRISQSKSKQILRSDGVLFKGTVDAARLMSSETGKNISQGNISMAASGKRQTAYGYTWSYAK